MVRAAILSLHSHADRSFLDDQVLALLSGDLRAGGHDNDLVVAVIERDDLDRLIAVLQAYDPIVYERVFDRGLVERLRAALPGRTFVSCEGEHRLDDPPADYVCRGELRDAVPALLDHLRGLRPDLPPDVVVRRDGRLQPGTAPAPRPSARPFRPNLHPLVVGARAPVRTFSLTGNSGCPYQADARDNPLYAGTTLPDGIGRGCAFCTTGNRSERRPPLETAQSVLSQLRVVRRDAPDIAHLVLKDQNPFGYLPEVVEGAAAEGLTGFTLLLETRADWFLKNEARFLRALDAAGPAGIRIAPFLVGIESFSPAELDRMNKGTTAETNERFLAALDRWAAVYPALDLSHASFGFILFTPWTTLRDLRLNLEAIERTGFDRLRGHVLLSRARLYPDTALHYLAERDGLLAPDADPARRRYGYFPARAWRFADPQVARFAELATELTELTQGRDNVRLFGLLLQAFEHDDVDKGAILAAHRDGPAPAELRRRFARLIRPLALDRPFAGGWRFGPLGGAPGRLSVRLEHEEEAPLLLEIVPRGEGPRFERSRHYDLRHRHRALSALQDAALRAVCAAITANDR